MTQHELLDRLEADLREMLDQVRTRIAPLPEEALRVRPALDKWNMLECFAHVNAYTDHYLSRIELAIHKAKARKWAAVPKLRSTWRGRRTIRGVDPANIDRKRKKSPKKYNFAHKPLGKEEVKRFIINMEKLLRLLQLSREIDLSKPTIPMVQKWFATLNLGDLYQYLVAHARRHVLQAQRLIQ